MLADRQYEGRGLAVACLWASVPASEGIGFRELEAGFRLFLKETWVGAGAGASGRAPDGSSVSPHGFL